VSVRVANIGCGATVVSLIVYAKAAGSRNPGDDMGI